MFQSQYAPVSFNAASDVKTWTNRRGFGNIVFTNTLGQVASVPTSKLEPLAHASSCTYLNANALVPTKTHK